jgi:hypothetical protein
MFGAPLLGNRPSGPDNWDHTVDILSVRKLVEGYLIAADRPGSGGWLFRLKGIPRKILCYCGCHFRQARSSSCQASCVCTLRAHKLAEGDYDERAYGKASDVLFQKPAPACLAWAPESYGGWSVTNLMGES